MSGIRDTLRALLARDGLAVALGIRFVDAGAGHATVSMTVDARHLNFNGTCHGGAIFSLADTAFGLASNGHGQTATAIDAHLEHVNSHPEYIRVQNMLWGAALDPSSEFKPNVAEFMRIQRVTVADWVRGGQESGEIRKKIDPHRFAEQFYGGLIGINSQWLVSPEFDLATAYEDFKQSIVRLSRTQ